MDWIKCYIAYLLRVVPCTAIAVNKNDTLQMSPQKIGDFEKDYLFTQ